VLQYISSQKTKYSDILRRIELDQTRSSFEREIGHLHKQIYANPGRWSELNHLVVDAANLSQPNKPSQIVLSNFFRSIDPDLSKNEIDEKLVFVLMPLNKDQQSIYDIISKECQNLGLNVRRGDEINIIGPLLPHIVREMYRARFIIADINGRNPNVFYELGLAHGMGKPVLMIAENEEQVPFDMRQQQLVLYDSLDELPAKLRVSLSRLALAVN
jgi:hypothetical protein